MSDFDVRALEEAVILFYSSGSSNQQQAHEFLQAAQVSTQAWSFAWELMQPNKVFMIKIDLKGMKNYFFVCFAAISSTIFWGDNSSFKINEKLE